MAAKELTPQLNGYLRGLWFPSETEAPWTIPSWTLSSVEDSELRGVLRREQTTPIAEIPLSDLVNQIERRCQGYGDEGKAIAQQHKALAKFLTDHCENVQVFRVGKITVDILVVGKTSEGYVILQTQSVET